MKKTAILATIALALTLVAGTISASESGYSNPEFKFAMDYPAGWKMDQKSTVQRAGMPTPKLAAACFSKQKCKVGEFGKSPQINLVIVDLASSREMASELEQQFGGQAPTRKDDDKGAKAESCEVIEKGHKRWAGRKSIFATTRCSDGRKWRYTTKITMKRKLRGMHNLYALECSMRSRSRYEADSLSEYEKELKPECEAAIASARMLK